MTFMNEFETIPPINNSKKTMDDILLDIAQLVKNDKYVQEDLSKYSSSQNWVKNNDDEYSQFIAAYEKGEIVGYSLVRRNPQNMSGYELVHSYAINNNPRIYNALELKAQDFLQNNGFTYNPLFVKETIKVANPTLLESSKNQQTGLNKQFPEKKHQGKLELLIA